MRMDVGGDTHQGLQRAQNQDRILINHGIQLFAVADGVEESPFGGLASQMAIEELENIVKDLNVDSDATPPFEDVEGLPLPARALKFAMREVNRRIYEKAREHEKYQGMGSTLTALWMKDDRAYIAHVGDSRAYLIRNGRAQQLTRDHTSIAEKSAVKVEDIELYDDYNPTSEHELTRAIGINPDVQVQLAGGTPRPGDYLVLCTDGLYGEVREFEIVDTIMKETVQGATMKLIQLANSRGGSDNVAIIILSIS